MLAFQKQLLRKQVKKEGKTVHSYVCFLHFSFFMWEGFSSEIICNLLDVRGEYFSA